MAIAIIAAKNLTSAINAFGKAASTFAEKQHQLAASAVTALNADGELKYVQALYEVTPLNYRGALREYMTNFGKCRFAVKDADGKVVNKFVFAKGKKIEPELVDQMMTTSPAEFAKVKKANGGTAPTVTVTPAAMAKGKLEKLVASMNSMIESFETDNVPAAVITALEIARDKAKAAMVAAAKADIAIAKSGDITAPTVKPTVETVKPDNAALVARRVAKAASKANGVPALSMVG